MGNKNTSQSGGARRLRVRCFEPSLIAEDTRTRIAPWRLARMS